MSGGHFDYKQHYIADIADEVERVIAQNDSTEKTRYGDDVGRHYPPEIIAAFCEGVRTMRRAAVYAQRIDWLLSADDGPEQFFARLAEDLGALEPRSSQTPLADSGVGAVR